MNICVYGAASADIDEKYTASAEMLGEKMVKRGHSLVFGGGSGGMMGGCARGVCAAGGTIIGVVPKFFDVDGILFDNCDELIRPDTMRERKQIMEDRSDAFIMTPGGIGTFEEFFEILTLKQLGRHNKPIVVLNINDYFKSIIEMIERAVKEEFMTERSKTLFHISEDIDEALDFIENYVPEEFNILEMRKTRLK